MSVGLSVSHLLERLAFRHSTFIKSANKHDDTLTLSLFIACYGKIIRVFYTMYDDEWFSCHETLPVAII